jgi:WD repeat-containing protein 68
MGLPSILQYDASCTPTLAVRANPVPLYGVAFSNNPQHPHRVALSSFLTGPQNKLTIVEPNASYTASSDLQQLATAGLTYPATKVGWEPKESLSRDGGRGELLATTGDVLRIWEMKWDGSSKDAGRIGYGRNGYNDAEGWKLHQRSFLSNVGADVCTLTRRASRTRPTFPQSRALVGTRRRRRAS